MYSTEGDEESDGEDELGDEEEEADEADEAEEAEDGIQEGDERVPGGFLRELKPGLSYGRNARLKRNEVLFCADKETQKRISDLVIANHNQRYFKRYEPGRFKRHELQTTIELYLYFTRKKAGIAFSNFLSCNDCAFAVGFVKSVSSSVPVNRAVLFPGKSNPNLFPINKKEN
ncbi:hypothetical protein CYMTET_19969 [Cymbomonas tetramitiformis]|uniref:Uncharacterized protein n=1 Tax=Cymbomonas tetramitiformis TaxID=36881 RepID=A0AAE0L4M8_9CHLO|nr:hypothetical protein CYMTET_19969 [Cymbomonas tetramitiformis]